VQPNHDHNVLLPFTVHWTYHTHIMTDMPTQLITQYSMYSDHKSKSLP